MSPHHCEWMLQISSFDCFTSVVRLGQLYQLYVVLPIPLLLIVLIHLLIVPINLWIVPIHLLNQLIHLLTMPIHLLNQPMPQIYQFYISRSHIFHFLLHSPFRYETPIPHFYNYCPMICLSFEVLKSILFYLQDLPSILFRHAPHLWFLCYTIFIFHLHIIILLLKSTSTLFPIYWHLLFLVLNFRFHVFVWFELIHINQHTISFKLINCY